MKQPIIFVITPTTKQVFLWLIKKLESDEYKFNITKAILDADNNNYYIEAKCSNIKGRNAFVQLENLFLQGVSFTYKIKERT